MATTAEEDFEGNMLLLGRVSSIIGHSLTDDSWYRFPKRLIRWVYQLYLLTTFIAMYHSIIENKGDISIVANNNIYIASVTESMLKLVLYSSIRPQLIELVQKVRIFRQTSVQTEREIEIVTVYTKQSKIIFRAVALMYVTILCSFFALPLILRLDRLPLVFYLPIGPKSEMPYFAINYAHQFLATTIVVSAFGAIDILFVFLLQEACLQLDIIVEKLSHVGEPSKDGEVSQEEQKKILKQIHILHMESREFISEVDTGFSGMMFFLFASRTYGITFLMFSATSSAEFDVAVLLVSLCFQIFLWSYFGEQTKTRMNKLVHEMTNNYWYNLDINARKSLIIMSSCCQNDRTLSAGGLVDLSLGTFVSIMKTAYSYYAVMKDTTSK